MTKNNLPTTQSYLPLVELTRGKIIESIHHGAFAVVAIDGNLLMAHGNTGLITFMRSSAKPFQILPFIERGGHQNFNLTPREIALMCASHSGTDEHMRVLQKMQTKIGISEKHLQCGSHPITHEETLRAMILRDEQPTPNRHNCSGKHTGMLAHASLRNLDLDTYLELEHPIQKDILQTVGEMCNFAPDEIELGIDGCSAPNFALPLFNAALGFARLCDPHDLSPNRAMACKTITDAMSHHADMVAGPDRFDTRLMQTCHGKIITKTGAEGFQGIGIMPGAISPDSPGIGVAIKISDGDQKGRARPVVALEILRQLGAINNEELDDLKTFGPVQSLQNWRMLTIGEMRPTLKKFDHG